mmetsp:Transcript_8137/g.15012  ORF Transcript_8137/g.15012 Transcript_8137/m.15012 type:complete len:101 (+) Transcript_8137:73-375(+)
MVSHIQRDDSAFSVNMSYKKQVLDLTKAVQKLARSEERDKQKVRCAVCRVLCMGLTLLQRLTTCCRKLAGSNLRFERRIKSLKQSSFEKVLKLEELLGKR